MESKITAPNGRCAQDAAGIGVADECRRLLVCCAMCPRSAKHTAAGANRIEAAGAAASGTWQHMALARVLCHWLQEPRLAPAATLA